MLVRGGIGHAGKDLTMSGVRHARVGALLALALATSVACVPRDAAKAVEPAVAEPAVATVSPESVFERSEAAIVVTKHARRLELFRRGLLVEVFPIVLGAQPSGAKRFEGDMRTPEGLYRVAAKRTHDRWRYFIALDYPTPSDRTAYDAEIQAGKIPSIGGKVPGLGGNLGIHGNDRPRDQASGKDWTKGCVAMRNEDVALLYKSVDVGTPVIVLP
jgi:murein L,D-transpeptidase YafK